MKIQKITQLMAVCLIFSLAACSISATKEETGDEAKNKEAIQKVNDAFNTGNTEGLENYVAENMIEHQQDPMIKTTGLAGLKDMIKIFRGAYPDMKYTVLGTWAEGDVVIMHFNLKGTNSGAMGEMSPTNKSIDVNGVDIVRFENGKGVEHWGYMEEGKMMTQLGMMPSPGGTPADTTNLASH